MSEDIKAQMRTDFQALHELVKRAKERLPRHIWDYLQGATETETTMKRNRSALDRIAFRPRVLNDMREIDTSSTFFGEKVRLPVSLCPIGSLESFCPEGPREAAKAAADFGVPFFLSSVGTFSPESFADIGGTKVFALYKRGDDKWLDEIMEKAVAGGFDYLSLTVDSAWYSRRERDITLRFNKPWRANDGAGYQAALNWSDVARCKKTYDIPLILKGIATAEDAKIALDHGVDMVFVSNHGGRQLDHGRGSTDVLPEVLEAVDGKILVMVDGAYVRGTDVVKARALGAVSAGMGRMLCVGLAAGGAAGVYRVLELLEEECKLALGLLGVHNFDALEAAHLHPAEPVTAPHVWSAFPHLSPDIHHY